MKIVCVVHEEERILDVTREADRSTIREWESGTREEIRRSESEASRIVQVIMELQQERRLGDKAEHIGGIHLEPMRVVGLSVDSGTAGNRKRREAWGTVVLSFASIVRWGKVCAESCRCF